MNHLPEIALFVLVSFLPYLILELLAFRRSLRFSPGVTAALSGGLSVLLIGFGMWFAEGMKPVRLIQLQSLFGGLFFLLAAKDQIGKKLFMLLMIANDANLVLVLAGYLQQRFFPVLARMPYHWSVSLLMLAIEALILSPMFFYVHWTFAQTLSGKRRLHAWSYLWLIPLTFYGIWLILFCFGGGPETQANGASVLITLMLFLGGIFVYAMAAQLIKEHRRKEELQETEYARAIQQTQYEFLQDRIEEARRAKHDLRHHIHLVSAYLNDGKLEELRGYLRKYSDGIFADAQISYCDHYAVNALLAYFGSQAKAAGIRYDVSMGIPARMEVPDEALVVVLGNLLENAINACREENDAPEIHVYGRVDESAVFFKITNSCTRRGNSNSPRQQGQGIGLDSVKSIALQYDGIMETRQQDGLFTASIMLTFPDVSVG